MSRRSTGGVVVRATSKGQSYALRFRALGRRQFVTLGTTAEGWDRARAEAELAYTLEQVRRGEWAPPVEHVAEAVPARPPDFHTFASEFFASREHLGLRPRTLEHIKWTLVDHLLPYFRGHELSAITAEEVDRFVRFKVREGRLGPASINRTVTTLAAVLEVAVEYELITRNPAKGKRRKLPTTTPARPFLEPDQVAVLLAAAGELDAEDGARRPIRRPLLATLAYSGVRVGELLALTWTDVDLATKRIRVRASKTDAGVRTVDVQPELRAELVAWKLATRHGEPGHLVFGTATGRPDGASNVRRRVVRRAVERANERIARDGGCEPLPEGLSPHGLRRTFASWLVAEGEDPAYVMQQLGHVDPKMTLGLYARALKSKRRRADGEAPAARARMGTESLEDAPEAVDSIDAAGPEPAL